MRGLLEQRRRICQLVDEIMQRAQRPIVADQRHARMIFEPRVFKHRGIADTDAQRHSGSAQARLPWVECSNFFAVIVNETIAMRVLDYR